MIPISLEDSLTANVGSSGLGHALKKFRRAKREAKPAAPHSRGWFLTGSAKA